jgi:hypothetical protein
MKTYRTIVSSALVAFAVLMGAEARADNMASIAITPATGVATLTPRWAIGSNLAGFHQMAQDLGLTGSVANNFYSIKSTVIPAGGDTLAFNFYVPGSGFATPHADIGSKLTPNSYSALTSADPDVGYGSVNLYLIHHKGTTDYFAAIIPGSASASAVTDEKPMSGPGGPGTVTGVSGYFGLTFAASNLGYGLNNFYYLRTDPATGLTKFGTLAPALLGSSADQFDLGAGGHNALAFTGTDVGYGTDKMYYLRLDPVTGFTIFGLLNPALAGVRHTSDIANLGSVYSTLTFAPGDVGFGSGQFYTTGAVNPTWQSVSFAAIADRGISAGSFTVNPTASSALPITLTVVAGSIGSASISTPVGGVFTVTPTAPGLITLQATQAGQAGLYEFNMLRQSFTVAGVAPLSRIVNFSARALSGPGAQTLIMGFVVSGNGAHLLVRGIGPTLATYGVSNVLVDPMLTLNAGSGVAATDDNWETDSNNQPVGTLMASTAVQVGAFPLPAGSKDAALLFTANAGPYTTSLVRSNSTTGVALTEVYDTDRDLNSRLINVSARINVALGDGTLIAGFVIAGSGPKTVLIRGAGPALSGYGVSGVLSDPQITVYSAGTVLASNDNWETGTSTANQISTAAAQVGAFPFSSSSKDSSLLVTLQPGPYSVVVTGVGSTTGVALVEIYDAD